MSLISFLDKINGTYVEKRSLLSIDLNGNISAGKSTVGEKLAAGSSRIFVAAEHGHEHGVLDQWVEDRSLTAVFQSIMQGACFERATQCETIARYASAAFDLVVNDRSLMGNAAFEAVSYHLNKEISDVEHRMYQTALRSRGIPLHDPSHLNVYLWAKPKVCYDRNRGRGNEVELDNYVPDHFIKIDQAHFIAALENLSSPTPTPFLILNWGTKFGKMENFYSIVGDCVASRDTTPTRVVLTRSPSTFEVLQGEEEYTTVLNLADKPLDAKYAQNKILTAVACRDAYSGPKKVLVLVPPHTPEEWYGGCFKLSFV